MIKRYKGLKAKCDQLASKIVRSKGYCENCGSREWLQCSHIISRRYNATRCLMDNLQVLCARCHRHFTDHPVEFAKWVSKSVGDNVYEYLYKRAHSNVKVDWQAEYERLKEYATTNKIVV